MKAKGSYRPELYNCIRLALFRHALCVVAVGDVLRLMFSILYIFVRNIKNGWKSNNIVLYMMLLSFHQLWSWNWTNIPAISYVCIYSQHQLASYSSAESEPTLHARYDTYDWLAWFIFKTCLLLPFWSIGAYRAIYIYSYWLLWWLRLDRICFFFRSQHRKYAYPITSTTI